MSPKSEHLIVDNRRARHDYHLLERVEAGIVLTGTEVKSLRDGRASLQQAYGDVREGEAWLVGAHISVYDQGNLANHDPDRDRKLLLHRKEVDSLAGKVAQKGPTLVPSQTFTSSRSDRSPGSRSRCRSCRSDRPACRPGGSRSVVSRNARVGPDEHRRSRLEDGLSRDSQYSRVCSDHS